MVWIVVEATRATEIELVVAPGAATQRTGMAGRRPLRIDARAVGIIVPIIQVTAPLPNIKSGGYRLVRVHDQRVGIGAAGQAT